MEILSYQELLQTMHPFKEIMSIGYFWDDPLKRLDFLNGVHGLADHFQNFWNANPDERGVAISRIHKHQENYKKNLQNHKGKVERDLKDMNKQQIITTDNIKKKEIELKKVETEMLTNNDYQENINMEKALEEKKKYKNVMDVLDGRLNSLKIQFDHMTKVFKHKEEEYTTQIDGLIDHQIILQNDLDISRSLIKQMDNSIKSELNIPSLCEECQSTLSVRRENLIIKLHSMDLTDENKVSDITIINPIVHTLMRRLDTVSEEEASNSGDSKRDNGDESDNVSDWSV